MNIETNQARIEEIRRKLAANVIEAPETPALAALLALCRMMFLQCAVVESDHPLWPWIVRVSFRNWPTDFFMPRLQHGSFSTHAKDPVTGLQQCIAGVVAELERNAEAFRRGFMEYYKADAGQDWLP